jgi:hypothetical protein
MDEDRALIGIDFLLNVIAFKLFIGAVNIEVIRLIKKKWLFICDFTDDNAINIELGLCQCQLLLRYSLPYKYFLLRIYQIGLSISKSLIHPRW